MKPTLGKSSWTVWTNNDVHGGFAMSRPDWVWAAYGPLGSESGVAQSAEEAVARAHSAVVVLASPEQFKQRQQGVTS